MYKSDTSFRKAALLLKLDCFGKKSKYSYHSTCKFLRQLSSLIGGWPLCLDFFFSFFKTKFMSFVTPLLTLCETLLVSTKQNQMSANSFKTHQSLVLEPSLHKKSFDSIKNLSSIRASVHLSFAKGKRCYFRIKIRLFFKYFII